MDSIINIGPFLPPQKNSLPYKADPAGARHAADARAENVRFDDLKVTAGLRSPADVNAREVEASPRTAPFQSIPERDLREVINVPNDANPAEPAATPLVDRVGLATNLNDAVAVDTYEFSTEARVQAARQLAGTAEVSPVLSEEVMDRISQRLAKNNAIRNEIAAGTYETADRIAATVDRLLDVLI
ncbi:MAG: hypothetical protein ACPGXK_02930 [Phycisphaerae bacterium]